MCGEAVTELVTGVECGAVTVPRNGDGYKLRSGEYCNE